MRWSGKVGSLFLLPAVIWVLVFTIFPLGYSLYLSLHNVTSKVEVVGREEVPVLDADGNPVLKPNGEPRTRTEVIRELNRTFTWNDFANYGRAFRDGQVRDAAVFGIPHKDWGEEVKAVIELAEGFTESDDLKAQILDDLSGRLAKFKMPRSIDVVDELPRQANGKLMKRTLKEPYWADAK